MKKIIILTIFVGLLLLSGCEFSKKGDAKYECQVSVRPTGKDPCNFIGGKDHICQIYDKSFVPDNDVPDFCTEKCLDRSKFLTPASGWGHAIDLDCIEVSLAHSGFAKPDMSPEERRINTVSLVYEGEEDKEEECDPNSDTDCCFNLGKCWIDGSCKDCGKGDCQFNSDCAPICEGNLLWDRDCDMFTKICKKARSNDCTAIKDTIAGFEVSRVCKGSACVIDEASLRTSRNDLRDQYNEYTYARQEITELRLKFNRDCLRALSDVTNKLIIDSALMLKSVPTKMMDLITDNTGKLIDTGLNKMVEGNKPKMSTEEYIAYSCSMDKVLTQELKLIDKKQEKVLEQIKEIESKWG